MSNLYFLEVFGVMIIMDFIWLNTAKKMYQDMVVSVQKTQLTVNLWAAVLCYLVLYFGIVFISIPFARTLDGKNKNFDKVVNAVSIGALFGLVVYAVFNLTNLSIFKDYSVKVALIDTLWGCTLGAVTTCVGVLRA